MENETALPAPGASSNARQSPLALTYFYRELHDRWDGDMFQANLFVGFRPLGTVVFADQLLISDLGPVENDPARQAWREAIRGWSQRVTILIDRPDFLLAEIH